MELVLGIDLGTTNFKACVFDRDGAQRGLGRVAVQPETGHGSLFELPVDRFWKHLRQAIEQGMRQAGAAARDVRAMGYSSQASSFLLLDDRDRPLTPLVLWPDRRASQTDPKVEALWARPDFLRVTGLGVGPVGTSAPSKIRWFQKRRPEVWARARRVMTISDYLVYCLTGQPVGDGGTAVLLGLMDLRALEWWPTALEVLGIDGGKLSRPLRPGASAGPITDEGAGRLGLGAGIPLAVGSLDHHMAAIGAGLDRLSKVSESTGTVTACIRHTDRFAPRPNCTCGPGLRSDQYYELAFDENGAGVLDWYQREHAPGLSIPELLEIAEDVPANGDRPVALPLADRYPGLEGFTSRSPSHHHGHYVRAILDSTAGSLAALIGCLYPRGGPGRIIATGGGARSDFWLQVHADRLGADIITVQCEEPACCGAAMVAATAAGWFADCSEASASWVRPRKVFSPR